MSTQADIEAADLPEEQMRRLRLRKVYIQLRIPRVRAEIANLAARKKTLKDNPGEASKELIEEKIYNNQHLSALRKELESLEEERKSVLEHLRKSKLEDREKMPEAKSSP